MAFFFLACDLFGWDWFAALTPPPPSRITNTNPPRFPLHSSTSPYSRRRLLPFCSSEYPSFHVSTSCSLGGTNSRISSASALLSNRSPGFVLSLYPCSVSGVNGGGWKGDKVRFGAWNTPKVGSVMLPL